MPIPLTALHPVAFTPPALVQRNIALIKEGKPPIDLMIRVPTMYERDSFTAGLVRGGVINYSRQQVRELMLAGVVHLYPAEDFDRIRAELESLWQASDANQDLEMRRLEKYIELMEQQADLPDAKKMTDEQMDKVLSDMKPDVILDEPTRVRVTAIQQDVTSRYEPLHKAFADLAEQDTRRNWLSVELHVVNWHGLEHTPEGNGRGGLQRHEAEYLRQQIGEEAFNQVGGFILALQTIDGDEEKNLASLIESSSAPIGSKLAESMTKKTDEPGSLTDAPSTETPDTGSPETTGTSSNSTRRSKRKTAPSGSSPTDKQSSTSPSN